MDAIRLRPATVQDADLLLEWRNDPDTKRASHNDGTVQREQHLSWLTAALGAGDRRLLIAEENGIPVGTVRVDFSDGVQALSWTVAPEARGRGVGRRMVALAASQITESIRAEVKVDNISSVRIAEHAGMVFEQEVNGILHFSRAASKQ